MGGQVGGLTRMSLTQRSAWRTRLRMVWSEHSTSRASSLIARRERTSSTIWRRNSGGDSRCVRGIVDSSSQMGPVSTKADQLQTGFQEPCRHWAGKEVTLLAIRSRATVPAVSTYTMAAPHYRPYTRCHGRARSRPGWQYPAHALITPTHHPSESPRDLLDLVMQI